MRELPLFPLGSVLFPGGRIQLQIFEQRYLDLVRDCLKQDTGFGLVWILRGDEVALPGGAEPSLAELGTYARIVDWDQLPNGLLGITIEGSTQFYLDSHRVEANKLVIGNVELLPAMVAEPIPQQWQSLVDVLLSLEKHPHVKKLGIQTDHADAWQVGRALAQLLPMDESLKFELLLQEEIEPFMERLTELLDELGGLTA